MADPKEKAEELRGWVRWLVMSTIAMIAIGSAGGTLMGMLCGADFAVAFPWSVVVSLVSAALVARDI